jgi:uncharacterized protein YjbJ (UPF0337 family)
VRDGVLTVAPGDRGYFPGLAVPGNVADDQPVGTDRRTTRASGNSRPPADGTAISPARRHTMSKERIEGAIQKGVGSVKETLGDLTGSDKLKAEGLIDKLEGSAKEAIGKAKDAIHKATR